MKVSNAAVALAIALGGCSQEPDCASNKVKDKVAAIYAANFSDIVSTILYNSTNQEGLIDIKRSYDEKKRDIVDKANVVNAKLDELLQKSNELQNICASEYGSLQFPSRFIHYVGFSSKCRNWSWLYKQASFKEQRLVEAKILSAQSSQDERDTFNKFNDAVDGVNGIKDSFTQLMAEVEPLHVEMQNKMNEVKRIDNEMLNAQEGLRKSAASKVVYDLDTIRIESKNNDTGALVCAAKLTATIKGWGQANKPITYRAEKTTDNDIYVTLE